jgi:hypothetical protein
MMRTSHALERLDYRMERLLADAGIPRADLDDPDGRIPCTVWFRCFAERGRTPDEEWGHAVGNLAIGAFPLIDYLTVTSARSLQRRLARPSHLFDRRPRV